MICDGYLSFDESSEEEIAELIDFSRENPLIWEEAQMDDLDGLPLNHFLIEILKNVKRKNKKYSTQQEFILDLGVNEIEAEIISIFVRVKPPPKEYSGYFSSFTAFTNKTQGYNLTKNLNRIRTNYTSGNFWGFVTECDQDEPQVWDYTNFSFKSTFWNNRLTAMIGSFRFAWGQGIIFSRSYFNSKSSRAVNNMKGDKTGLFNYLGTDENRFFHGLGSSLKFNKVYLYSFVTNTGLDATLSNGVVENFRTSGFHISQSQEEARNLITEKVFCTAAVSQNSFQQTGFLLYGNIYSDPLLFLKMSDKIYGGSVFHKTNVKNFSFSGECVFQGNGEYGFMESGKYQVDNVILCIGFRRFSPGLYSRMGNPVKEFSGSASNEKGWYSGIEIRTNRGLYLSSYFDVFNEIVSQGNGESVIYGNESLLFVRKKWKDLPDLFFKFKRTVKNQTTADIPTVKKIDLMIKTQYNIFPNTRLVCRFNKTLVTGNQVHERGSAINFSSKLTNHFGVFIFGVTYFYSSSFDSRIYLYEPGMPRRFNILCLSGNGNRVFLVWQNKISELFELDFSLKTQTKFNQDNNKKIQSYFIEMQLVVDF